MRRAWLAAPVAVSVLLSGCSSIGVTSTGASSSGQTASGRATARAFATSAASGGTAQKPGNYVLIMDASGSMRKADVGAGTRMAAAQAAASRFVSSLPTGSEVGLVTYGDKTLEEAPKSAGCGDVSVAVPLGPDSAKVKAAAKALRPVGWTPIAKALRTAAAQAKGRPLNIVLVTDGEDSCAPPDPCETAASLVARYSGLTISAIGLKASSDQLACIASKGKGYFVTANNSIQLARRLEALRDPAAAARTLSPSGVESIRPGQLVGDIRKAHPDFPEVASGAQVRVVWAACVWVFSAKGVLVSIAPAGSGSTIDGLAVGDAGSALTVLGAPVSSSTAGGVETRIYAADERLGLGWKVQIKGGRILTIVLCTCLTGSCPPSSQQIRGSFDDPYLEITKVSCTDDGQWAVVEGLFWEKQDREYLLYKKEGSGWAKPIHVGHGGDCWSIPDDTPFAEIDEKMGGLCAVQAAVSLVKASPITMDGVGRLRLGASLQSLTEAGVIEYTSECPAPTSSGGDNYKLLGTEGYDLRFTDKKLTAIMINVQNGRTSSGAEVGMNLKDLENLYHGMLTKDRRDGQYSYQSAGRTLAFSYLGESDMVTEQVQAILIYDADSPWSFC